MTQMTHEQRWQQLTLRGNALFERGEHPRALLLYEQARCLALKRFARWPCSDDAIAALVVSYLNLSEAQARCGELDAACLSLCTVHTGLLRARDNEDLQEGLREAAALHLRESFAALVRFREVYGERPALHRLLCPECWNASEGISAPQPTLH